MNFSIVLYNNKYVIFQIVYYSYTSVAYIGKGLNSSFIYIGHGLNKIGKNITNYIYSNENELDNTTSPILCDIKNNMPNIEYIPQLATAPPQNMLQNTIQNVLQNTYKEYIMVEKGDLLNLLTESGNNVLYNKYINLY